MDNKMMDAWKAMQSAYKTMESCMGGYQPSEKEMAGGEMPKEAQMPTQEDGAEPGSYEGKGMMSDKKSMLMAAMKSKGY